MQCTEVVGVPWSVTGNELAAFHSFHSGLTFSSSTFSTPMP